MPEREMEEVNVTQDVSPSCIPSLIDIAVMHSLCVSAVLIRRHGRSDHPQLSTSIPLAFTSVISLVVVDVVLVGEEEKEEVVVVE